MIKLFWPGLLAVLLLSGCGWNGTPTRHNDFVPLTSIKIVAAAPAIETSHTIAKLTSTKLMVIGDYSGVFTRDITDQATWVSDNTAVASFSAPTNPRVTGGSVSVPQAVIITATVGSLTAKYTLTVSAATINAIMITPDASLLAPLPKGKTIQFSASGTFSDLTTQDLTFDVDWISSDIAVATVGNVSASKGLAKAEAAVGTATITATFGSVSKTTQLTVTAPTLQSIAVTPPNSSVVGISQPVNFIATGTYSDGTTPVITNLVTWASTNTSIATIIPTTGVATSVAAGTTSISATLNGVSGNTGLTVTALVLTINPTSQTLAINGTRQFTLTATPAGGTSQDVTASTQWTSSATSIATVGDTTSDKGLVTGKSGGQATITATYSGQFVSAAVTITP